MLRRSTTLAVTALVAGALLSAPASPASAAAEMCQGRPATIVGSGPDIEGTPGDDVIVTGTSGRTRAGAGNDLICVSSSALRDVYTDAGEGNDVIDASAAAAKTSSVGDLRSGIDRYLGGPGTDFVRADGLDDEAHGGGGSNGTIVHVDRPIANPPGLYIGSGSDFFDVHSALPVVVELDKQVVIDGVAADIAGFSRATVVAPSLVLRGNPSDNSLSVLGCDVKVYGGGGDDWLGVADAEVVGTPRFDCEPPEVRPQLNGGRGDDTLTGGADADVLVGGAGSDLLRGRTGSDVLRGGSGRDDLRGNNELDVLRGGGGRDDLRGGAGPDVLRGNAGNDTMNGDPGNDIVIGDVGRDTADGQNGRDRCVAERERRCER